MVLNLKSRRNKKSAFTLIELLVVVLILGILIAVAIPLYLTSVRNAGTRTVEANIKTLATAGQAYRVAKGDYPTAAEIYDSGNGDVTQGWGTGDYQALGPGNPGDVGYVITPTGATELQIVATENGVDRFGDAETDNSITYTISNGVYQRDWEAVAP